MRQPFPKRRKSKVLYLVTCDHWPLCRYDDGLLYYNGAVTLFSTRYEAQKAIDRSMTHHIANKRPGNELYRLDEMGAYQILHAREAGNQ